MAEVDAVEASERNGPLARPELVRRTGDLHSRASASSGAMIRSGSASSTEIRSRVRAGEVAAAAKLLGRPAEVEGEVVVGERRGGTLGYPTANLAVPPELLVPSHGIYAGAALGHRGAVSIGVNPHYGGVERRVEAYLLDFAGDLYGQRLVVELWQRLRDEQAFASEEELVGQIARDVDRARGAMRPGG